MRKTWDIFCTVVDNYGDIGVCWRLARQLANEHGRAVRLWVDDLASLQRIAPGVDVLQDAQMQRGVEVRRWTALPPGTEPAQVVIEAFACHLPEAYVEKMAAQRAKPAWINLEYLSAEQWVEESHALPSPHARLPLTKFFFFPGFGDRTGGLLREGALLASRTAFQRDTAAQNIFWRTLDLPARSAGEWRVSLFSYANAALPGLLEVWSTAAQRITCLVPEGPIVEDVQRFFGVCGARQFTRGNLKLHVLPFMEQDSYDKLLWACDVNFVRGEDSFVRAQWAARPFIWHIYPQKGDAHWPKLEAFLDIYTHRLDPGSAARIKLLWRAWNEGVDAGAAWRAFGDAAAAIQAHTAQWADSLHARPDLAGNLANFCDKLL